MTKKESIDRWYAKHGKEYRLKNIEKLREYNRNWIRKQRQKNPEKYREICRKWRREHPERIKELYQKYYLRLKMRIFEKLGNKCVRCGFSDSRALQIDHIYGGGVKEIKTLNNRQKFLKKVLMDKKGKYQILCANCNAIKKVENKEIKA